MAPHLQPNITLGTDQGSYYESVYRESYKRVVGSSKDRAAFKENSKYLRGHHFAFGTSKRDEAEKGIETASKDAYRDPGREFFKNLAAEQVLQGKQKQAVQRANFTLGCDTDPSNYKSIHTLEISEAAQLPREKTSEAAAAKAALRSSNLHLGSDGVDYTSTCGAAHVHFRDVDRGPDLKERTRALRKSSFLFGTDAVNYESAAAAAYSNHGFAPQSEGGDGEVGARGVNFKIGDTPTDYASENRRSFSNVDALNAHCRNPTRLDPNKKKELRSHNFNFGSDQPKYSSLSSECYGAVKGRTGEELAKEKLNMEHIKKDLRATHITLGQNNKLETLTASKAAYLAPTAKQLRAAAEDRNTVEDRGVHYTLGTDDEELKRIRSISLAQDSMQAGVSGVKYNSQTLDSAVKADLRKSHFHLGSVQGAGDWVSTSASNYVAHKDVVRSVMSEETKKDLRASHYQLGGDEGYPKDMKSTMQEQMTFFGPAPTDGEQQEERSNAANFVLGTSKLEYSTVARDAFRWPNGRPPHTRSVPNLAM